MSDFLEGVINRITRAKAARPDVPEGDLLVHITGEEGSATVAEINAGGKPMIFACARVSTVTTLGIRAVAGSVRVPCDRCKAPVWMSPATVRTYRKLANAVITCLECMDIPGFGS